MKKNLIICILLVALIGLEGHAQRLYRKPLKSTRQAMLGFSDYNVGVKIGCPWSVMIDSELQESTYDGHFGYSAGVFVERSFGRWSVALESDFAQKGTKMHNERPYQISLDTLGIVRTVYSVAHNVVSLRIPVTYYFKGMVKNDVIVPYVFAGPQVDLPLKFNLKLSDFTVDTIANAIITKFDGPKGNKPFSEVKNRFNPVLNVSAFAGLGIMGRIPTDGSAIIIKFDIAANYGIRNLDEEGFIWKQVTDDKGKKKIVLKENSHIIRAHDIEANLTVVFPIKKRLHDACYNFRRK